MSNERYKKYSFEHYHHNPQNSFGGIPQIHVQQYVPQIHVQQYVPQVQQFVPQTVQVIHHTPYGNVMQQVVVHRPPQLAVNPFTGRYMLV